MTTEAAGLLVGAAAGLVASPYLARLTLSAPDKELARWWLGRPATPRRVAVTALCAGLLGALAGRTAGLTTLFPAFLLLALVGAPLMVIDYEIHRLPNRLVFVVAVGAPLLALIPASDHHWPDYLRGVLGGLAVFAALGLLWLIAPRSFGLGDVKLGGVLGAYLGWFGWIDVYYGIFGGFLLGSVVAVALLVSGRADRKTPIAFGPMLLLGALIVLAFDLVPSLG